MFLAHTSVPPVGALVAQLSSGVAVRSAELHPLNVPESSWVRNPDDMILGLFAPNFIKIRSQ